MWLIKARPLLRSGVGREAEAIREIEKKKLEVKVFKTDRALTGKDKTNRAKRWEVLVGDFQHATIKQCWSAERKLIGDLVGFNDFPNEIRTSFVSAGLLPEKFAPTLCPVTLEPLSFKYLCYAVLNASHGVSQHQIGHLHPLKRGGNHDGSNVCWQSANGNRIQGDLSIDETRELLTAIALRMQKAGLLVKLS